jgi:FkbM family methyltransferase
LEPAEFVYTVLLRPGPLRRAANRILRGVIPPTVRVGGAVVCLNRNDPVVCGALAMRVYERGEIAYFRRAFRAGMTFVDVGANVGLYSALAARAGAAAILAIEPHEESFSFLEKTLAANRVFGKARAFRAAATDHEGRVILHTNPDNKGDNRIYADPMLDGSQTARGATLDALCTEADIARIDFLKMDVQGAELAALEGARGILASSPGCTIMMEFWPAGLERCGGSPSRLFALLEDLGFGVRELSKGRTIPVDTTAIAAATRGRHYRNLVCTRGANPGPGSKHG